MPSPAVRCPRCRNAIALPDVAGDCLTCGSCQARIRIKPREPGVPAPLNPAPAVLEGGKLDPRLVWTAVASGGVALLLIAVTVIWLSSRGAPAATPVTLVEPQQAKAKPKDEPAIKIDFTDKKPVRPVDPRVKIVEPAVKKGTAFLKSRILELTAHNHGVSPKFWGQEVWMQPGLAGLIGLTLLESGVPADDEAILHVADIIRSEAPRLKATYALSTSLFFMNRWHEARPLSEKDRQLVRSFALRIVSGQFGTPGWGQGVWGYFGEVLGPEQEADLLERLKRGGYKPSRATQRTSISNSQFAMLALWGARKHGVPVREPLLALARHFHTTQAGDGHWTYNNGIHYLHATSTCAGLISLAMEKALLEDKEFAGGPASLAEPLLQKVDLDKAFKYLARTIGCKKGSLDALLTPAPEGRGKLFEADALGDLYFLWSLERVSVIYDKEVIEGKNWFNWGYPLVLEAQQDDGSWHDLFGPLPDTCFALLFLLRANIAKDLTDKLRMLSLHHRHPGAAPLPWPPRHGLPDEAYS